MSSLIMREPVRVSVMPHAPVLLNELALHRREDVRAMSSYVSELAKEIVQAAPAVICIVSAKFAAENHELTLVRQAEVYGDFRHFGFSQIQVQNGVDLDASSELVDQLMDTGIQITPATARELRHDVSVPLRFLKEQGWSGSIVVLGVPAGYDVGSCAALGHVIRQVSVRTNRYWHVICSGELSHRHWADMPGGFHPDAKQFDEDVVQCLKDGHYDRLLDIDKSQQKQMNEDLIDSLIIGAGALNFKVTDHARWHYEVPVGIGQLAGHL